MDNSHHSHSPESTSPVLPHQQSQPSSSIRKPTIVDIHTTSISNLPFQSQTQHSQHPSQHPSQQCYPGQPARAIESFGYNCNTPENLTQLSSLSHKNQGDTIGIPRTTFTDTDCIAIIELVHPVVQIEKIGKSKRDLLIVDPSSHRRIILSGNCHNSPLQSLIQ